MRPRLAQVQELFDFTDGRPIAPIWWVVAIAVGGGGNLLAEHAGLPGSIQSVTLLGLFFGCLTLSPTRPDRRNDFPGHDRLKPAILVPTILIAVAAGPPVADAIGAQRWTVVTGIMVVGLFIARFALSRSET